ncbi:hypothetical protein DFQ01_13467 [Paenibacillus cellulosilyticus]|uniref:Uncharacterized protein n=1 Tax=Paenibacillus cellulosilyticus TaxID=375489 RepID=A0A2V2YKS8_9BACL|nr:hypothetical protein DFQ01_13467 [Paenibacillus cellulosilyticus]
MLERVHKKKQEDRKPIDIRVIMEQLGIDPEKWKNSRT